MLKPISFVLITLLGLFLVGCKKEDSSASFAIYLLDQNVSTAQLSRVDIDQLTLQNKPVVSSRDIVSYDKTSHTIKLTSEAYGRVQQIFSVPVKVDGIPFVVCVGKERIYTGAFWTPLSSLSYDGVVIMQSFDTTEPAIQISLGYPGPASFTGSDPRVDPRVMKALEWENKLK